MKRFISILLVAMMALMVMPVSVFAESTENNICGKNLTWCFDETTGELTVSGTGAMTNYSSSSPAPWDGYKTQIRKITVSDGVTTIGNDTFIGCEILEDVVLPGTLTKIGDSAFRDCEMLAEILIPDTVTSLGHYAFYGCLGLAELVAGDGVVTIGNYAFKECTNIKTVTLPDGLTKVGKGAFDSCDAVVYAEFRGTEAQWSEVTVGEDNEPLIRAFLRFGNVINNGDIDGDGAINSTDALFCLQYATENIVFMGDAVKAADVNSDGKINSFDALKILQISVDLV